MGKILIQFFYLGPIVSASPEKFLTEIGESQENQRQQLASFFGIKSADLNEELVERYIEVTLKKDHRAITPAHDKVRARIVEPLKIAKKSYCLGDYVTSIALSGIVGETLAHVFYQLYETQIDGIVFNSNLEKTIFGKSFDELGQMRRIEILSKLKYITSDQKDELESLQRTRRPYMHWWNLGKTADQIKNDAKKSVISATKLFSNVFDIKLASASNISIDGRVEAFLNRVGDSIGPYHNSQY